MTTKNCTSYSTDTETFGRFAALRADVFAMIAKLLEQDGHSKSYEGAFEICLPNYFEEQPDTIPYTDPCVITLHCYLLGPHRHYEWKGRTFADALDKCEFEVRGWLKDEQEYLDEQAAERAS